MDLETCSLCLTEVPDKDLREVVEDNPFIYPGARVCSSCRFEHPDIKTKRG